MTLPLDDHGLPLPGRELDKYIAGILGWKLDPDRCLVCGWEYSGTREQGCVPDDCSMRPPPQQRYDESYAAYSTTHAFFQVMEAMRANHPRYRYTWDFRDQRDLDSGEWRMKLQVELQVNGPWYPVCMWLDDYPDREHAYAHAVCACAYLAMGGEK